MINDDVAEESFVEKLKRNFFEQFATYLIAAILSLFAIFSDAITEGVKSAVNRSDDRLKIYESLASDFGAFLYDADVLRSGFADKWIKKRDFLK